MGHSFWDKKTKYDFLGVQLPPDAMQEEEMSSLEVDLVISSSPQLTHFLCTIQCITMKMPLIVYDMHDHDHDHSKVEIVDLKSVTSRTSSSGVSLIAIDAHTDRLKSIVWMEMVMTVTVVMDGPLGRNNVLICRS